MIVDVMIFMIKKETCFIYDITYHYKVVCERVLKAGIGWCQPPDYS